MKILITTEFSLSFQCGVTTAVINERKCLEALGHEVGILTIYKDKVSKYEDGVYYIRSNFPQLYKDSYAALILSDPIFEEIYEWNPDIVHSQCEFFTMACARGFLKNWISHLFIHAILSLMLMGYTSPVMTSFGIGLHRHLFL